MSNPNPPNPNPPNPAQPPAGGSQTDQLTQSLTQIAKANAQLISGCAEAVTLGHKAFIDALNAPNPTAMSLFQGAVNGWVAALQHGPVVLQQALSTLQGNNQP
jgi:hypothetical protein